MMVRYHPLTLFLFTFLLLSVILLIVKFLQEHDKCSITPYFRISSYLLFAWLGYAVPEKYIDIFFLSLIINVLVCDITTMNFYDTIVHVTIYSAISYSLKRAKEQ